MILIITNKGDFTADFVIDKLNQRSISYSRFNTEDVANTPIGYNLSDYAESLNINDLDSIHSVWLRRIKLPALDGFVEDSYERKYAVSEIRWFFSNLWEVLDAKWLSKPHHIYRAENKLFQLRKAKEVGFKIPDTIVSTKLSDIKDFYADNQEDVIVKPLYNNRYFDGKDEWNIYTNRVLRETLISDEQGFMHPCIFQENISKKAELRITVVDDKVFAASVDSQSNPKTKIDWRKDKTKFEPYQLPSEIENMCRMHVKAMNLSFGALDVILDDSGEYIFLENNPNGQWAWIEMDTGLKISESIINYLTQKDV